MFHQQQRCGDKFEMLLTEVTALFGVTKICKVSPSLLRQHQNITDIDVAHFSFN